MAYGITARPDARTDVALSAEWPNLGARGALVKEGTGGEGCRAGRVRQEQQRVVSSEADGQSWPASISLRHCCHCQRSAPSRPLGSIVKRSSCRAGSVRPVGEPSSSDSMTTQPACTPITFASPPASSSSSVANTAS